MELRRNLTLVDLTTAGLQRLRRDQLIEPAGAPHYERTARWAEALHADAPSADGLYWTAHRYDREVALLLFATESPRVICATCIGHFRWTTAPAWMWCWI